MMTSAGMRRRWVRNLTGRFSATVVRGVAAADLSLEGKLSANEEEKKEVEEEEEEGQEERKETEAGEVEVVGEAEVEEMVGERVENREGKRRVRGRPRCSTAKVWGLITRKEVVRGEEWVG